MEDPFSVLGLPNDANPQEVRDRYLQLVRQHPPERFPEEFARIRAAYDELRDPVRSVERRLFSERRTMGFDEIVSRYKADVRTQRLATEFLLKLGSQ